MSIFYVLIGPSLITANCPYKEPAVTLSLVSVLAGLMVALIHWRQPTTGGRVSVAVGTGLACLLGAGFWAVGLLALAFAGDSGDHAETLGKLMIGMTYAVLLIAPPLGAVAGSGLSAARRAPKAKAREEASKKNVD
jgi:hypothetical protein